MCVHLAAIVNHLKDYVLLLVPILVMLFLPVVAQLVSIILATQGNFHIQFLYALKTYM